MSWTDLRLPAAVAASFAAGLTLTACAGGVPPAQFSPGLTPTENYGIEVRPSADKVALRPNGAGLSAAQQMALQGLAGRWREAGADAPFTIECPADAPGPFGDSARAMLVSYGVPGELIRLAPAPAGAPLLVSYATLEAVGPDCSAGWTDLTRSRNNDGYPRFGCAVTANFAAQIADPRDLLAPRDSTPADATRRAVVLGKYRNGEPTATQADSQASAAMSTALKN